MDSKHGLDSPRRAPAPPWSSVATGRASASARLASRSGPLPDGAGRAARPAAAAPRRALRASATTGDSPSGGSRAAAPSSTAGSARAPRRRPRTERPRHRIQRIDRTARPEPSRSFREGWTPATTGVTVSIGRRGPARWPRGLGCWRTRALTSLIAAIYAVSAPDVTDDVQRSISEHFVRSPRTPPGIDSRYSAARASGMGYPMLPGFS
jgi:hypothetical protein